MPTKKLRYVPGLISLIGLPILFFIFNPQEEVDPVIITCQIPSDEPNSEAFTKVGIDKAIKGKQVEEVHLGIFQTWWDKDFLPYQKMDFIRREVERLQFTNDTSTVLKVVFNSESSFGEIVSLMNIAIIYRTRKYALCGNEFFLLADDPPSKVTIGDYQEEFINNPISHTDTEPEPSSWSIFYERATYEFQLLWLQSKNMWLLSIGFLILIITPSLTKWLTRKFHKSQLATS